LGQITLLLALVLIQTKVADKSSPHLFLQRILSMSIRTRMTQPSRLGSNAFSALSERGFGSALLPLARDAIAHCSMEK
jgi:hypothetical protein